MTWPCRSLTRRSTEASSSRPAGCSRRSCSRHATRRVRRAVYVLAAVAIGLAAYYFGGNLLLGSQLLADLVNAHPERDLIEWGAARTKLPGRIYVTDLRIRGRDWQNHWYLEIDRARVDIGLGSLMTKTVRLEEAD